MSSRFQRFLLPGFAFKAVVIGGGYATGRELAEFFLPSGPWGGVTAMLLATLIWSCVCVATFLFARASGTRDYQSFVRALLGPGWIAFEAAYLLFVILILAVFGAAAGEIAKSLGLPALAGTLALMALIACVVAYGNTSVERLFTYVSFLLYGVYALFLVLSLTHFGALIAAGFAQPRAHARLGHRWGDLRQLQHRGCGGDPAGAAPPDQQPRRGDRRAHRRTPGDAAGAAVLLLHDGLLPADRRCHAAV